MTIFLIEDEPALRASMARALRAEGFTIMEFSEAEPGMAAAAEHRPDLVICDFNLCKGATAGEVLAALRENAETADVPFLLTTGDAIPPKIRLGNHLPSGVIQKPFSLAELIGAVHGALNL